MICIFRVSTEELSSHRHQFEEIIFALSATIEGDTTMLYITKQLKDFSLTFSMLARGIPVGTELEYTDPSNA